MLQLAGVFGFSPANDSSVEQVCPPLA